VVVADHEVVRRVVPDLVLVPTGVAELHTSDTQPDNCIRIFQVNDTDFLKEFAESNGDLCSLGHTHKRVTGILNLGWAGKHRMAAEFDKFVRSELEPLVEEYRKQYGLHDLVPEVKWLLLRYDKNHYFDSHSDDSPGFVRRVSVVVYANDEYSGGDLVFDKLGITIKPKAGMVVVFPSSYTHSHASTPITNGVKYSLVNWYSFLGE
jgi:hypothetical protein